MKAFLVREPLKFTVPALDKRYDEELMFGSCEWLHVWRKTCFFEADEGRAALCLLDAFERTLTESKRGENPVLELPLGIWRPSGIPAGTLDDLFMLFGRGKKTVLPLTLFRAFSNDQTEYFITECTKSVLE